MAEGANDREFREADTLPPADGGSPDWAAWVIGPYEVQGELGRGGMATVYRARHTKTAQPVALKLIHSEHESSVEALARFQREAQAAAALAEHPGIVGVIDLGEHEGTVWAAMELIEGPTFYELIKEGDTAPGRMAALMAELAHAVHFAHGRGILHRDIKPANVLVAPDGHVRLTDFGLAKFQDAPLDETQLTRAGVAVGTPVYMSPEQSRGEPLDARSDVYSLGATLYEALAGEPPFVADSLQSVLRMIERDRPVPLRRHDATIPVDLELITQRCLEKQPGRRYATAAELAADLERFVSGQRVEARAPGIPERLAAAYRRRPAVWATGVAAVVLAGALGGGSAWRVWTDRAAIAADLSDAVLLTDQAPDQALGILRRLAERAPDTPGLAEAQRAAESRVISLRDERLREQVRVPMAQARGALADVEQLRTRLARMRGAAAGPQDTADSRRDARAPVEATREQRFTEAWSGFETVHKMLEASPGLAEAVEARHALGDLALARLREAEAVGDRLGAARFEAALREVAAERFAAELAGAGTLSITTDPTGATVLAARYEERGGRLEPGTAAELGSTPLRAHPLPMGSYRLTLRHPAFAPVHYPVLIGRNAAVEVGPPVRLLTVEQIGEAFCYVPGGESIIGGDADAYRSEPRATAWVDGVLISRFEITFQEYADYLQARLQAGETDAAVTALCPMNAARGARIWVAREGRIVVRGRVDPRWPACMITAENAEAYCAWRSEREGRPIRLPTAREWERAARGADGRWYPWGWSLDWSRVAGGVGPNPGFKRVGHAPGDVSPFGVRDLAGSIEEFTSTKPAGWNGLRIARGGAWGIHGGDRFRSATRFAIDSTFGTQSNGFRVAADLPAK